MPTAPPHPCSYPNCRALVPHGKGSRCDEHKSQRPDGRKPFAGAVKTQDRLGVNLYGKQRWQKARATYLKHNPWCVVCGQPAEVVDHIIDHRGDSALFWDTKNNWQSLCQLCHRAKTAKDAAQRRRPTENV